ncbi:hypothetical protein PPGU16_84250 (plasmid) [Paraburkholderia largidicola]|uniref:DUF1778 domain-containing protein n=1 Tax=Paraburkholderia largidicola TaxID=3014751 RepID=A0A7I8C561_9BURK|nr:hypothetical protein PPGU16_84250 [Paraburkholderia sp. PGU16]
MLRPADLPDRKEPVTIQLHPNDVSFIKDAAKLGGMEFDEFCALAIYKAARDIRFRST